MNILVTEQTVSNCLNECLQKIKTDFNCRPMSDEFKKDKEYILYKDILQLISLDLTEVTLQ